MSRLGVSFRPIAWFASIRQIASTGHGGVRRLKSSLSLIVGLGLSVCTCLPGIPSSVFAQSVPADAILPTPPDSTAAPAAGQFAVSDDGAATYSYPIWVPDGRRNLQPSLSLNYNSQVGSGILGVGWQLSGLSSITRCKRDMARDGYNAAIQFDSTDAYCLDGQRLVGFPSVADGITRTYGTEGAEYRTEQEQFAQIINGKVDDQGPLSFEVRLKNGLILSYGTRPASRLEGSRMRIMPLSLGNGIVVVQRDFNQRVRLTWALSEVRDRFGNNMILHYSLQGDSTQGYEQLPVSIRYTGTVDQNLPPRRLVEFSYETRPDTQTSFVSGLKLVRNHRLANIVLRAPNPTDTATVKEYVLKYKDSTATNRSLLQAISECDPQPVCLTPTTFSYSETVEDGFTEVKSIAEQSDRLVTGDINGDGCDDLITTYGRSIFPVASYRLSPCYNAIREGSHPLPSPSPQELQQLTPPHANAPNSAILAFVFNSPWSPLEPWNKCLVPSGKVIVLVCYAQLSGLDLDLDSRMDLFSHVVWEDCGSPTPPTCFVSMSANQTFDTRILLASSIPPVEWNPSRSLYGGVTHFLDRTHTEKTIFKNPQSPPYISTYIGDINGDGYPDLMKLTPVGWSFQLNHGRAPGELPPQPNCGTSERPCLNLDAPSPLWPGTAPKEGLANVFMADVFGEGTTSLILRDVADSSWYAAYRLSTKDCPAGIAVCPVVPAPNLGLMAGDKLCPKMHERFLDVNGDGLPDSVSFRVAFCDPFSHVPFPSSSPFISINSGNGFYAHVAVPASARLSSTAVLDYDGNGTEDLVVASMDEGEPLRILLTAGNIENYRWLPLLNQFGDPIPSGNDLQTFDVNGDGLMDLVQNNRGGFISIFIRNGNKRDLLTAISDRGASISVSYAPLTRRGLYSTSVPPGVVASSAPSSTYVMNKGPWVVESYSMPRAGSLDQNVRNQYSYTYADGRQDLSGRGWLGFGSVTSVDHHTQAKTIRTYDNVTKVGSAYPFTRRLQVVEHITKLSGSGRINHRIETTTYQRKGTNDGRYNVVLPQQVVRLELEGSSADSMVRIRNDVTQFGYDGFGNVTKSTSLTGDDYWEERLFSFQQNLSAWLISMRTGSVVTSGITGGAFEMRTRTYSPDPTTGIALEEILEPDGDNDTYLHITHHYDAHGVQTGSTFSDKTGSDTRCVAVQYDAESIYPTVSVNTLGHTTRTAIHPAFGTLTRTEDPNGVAEARQYDSFGRLRAVLPASGANLSIAYTSTGFPLMEATDAAGKVVRISYDAFHRVIEKRWKVFDGQTVVILNSYNGQDLLAQAQGPCYLGLCPLSGSETFSYDELGRLINLTHADGSARKVTYTDLKTTYVDESGNQRSVIEDQLGRSVKSVSVSAEGKEIPISYRYGPFGLLASITDPANNTVDTQYDIKGRVRMLQDPDRGSQTFQWTPFDELRESRDGNNLVTTYQYDRLGRVVKLANRDGITQFRWDTAAHGIGLLDRSRSPDGIESLYTYDALARTSAVASTIDGKVYDVKMTYDGVGRLSTIAYPEVRNHPRFAIRQQFNSFGYLQQVVDEQTKVVYWRIDLENERGQVISEAFGNGLTTSRRFDTRGFLRNISTSAAGNSIQDLTYDYWPNGSLQFRTTRFPDSSLFETFGYDLLDRLTNWSASSGSPDSLQPTKLLLEHVFEYDDLGNLRLRSMSSPGGPGHTLTYQYGGNGAGPHAVTHVNDDEYGYDTGGNQVKGPGRTVRYTSVGLPSQIGTGSKQFELRYDASDVRSVISDSTGDRTTYIGGLYEKRVHNGQATHVFYVPGLSKIIAQVEFDETSGKQSVLYLHHDRLASVQATTDQAGNVAERANYEPFGDVVDAANPAIPSPNRLGNVTLGFTEHNTDNGLNLINMTGRIYDPKIGRFLTPDLIIHDPAQSESLNPYSYVSNNPLKWVDPSGFEGEPSAGTIEDLGDLPTITFYLEPWDRTRTPAIPSISGTTVTSASIDDNGKKEGSSFPNAQVGPEYVDLSRWDTIYHRMHMEGINARTVNGYSYDDLLNLEAKNSFAQVWEAFKNLPIGPLLMGGSTGQAPTVGSNTARTPIPTSLKAVSTAAAGRGANMISPAGTKILDVSKIRIPGPRNSALGKVDYLLGNVASVESAGKGGFFRGIMGFSEGNLGPALERHLIENFGSATFQGSKISIVGQMMGPGGKMATVQSIWGITSEGFIDLITAYPR